MDKPSSSITVVVSKKTPDTTVPAEGSNGNVEAMANDTKTDSKSEQQSQQVADTTTATPLIEPLNKVTLLALFKTEALPIVNNVNSKILSEVNDSRVELYKRQHERTKQLYLTPAHVRPTYLVQSLKTQFIEYQRFDLARELDQRSIINADALEVMWQQIHIVDDLINEIVRGMPAQAPVGWQLTSGSRNHLKLPSVGRLRDNNSIADQASLNSYVLGHFGVMSYTFDRGYFIGHVLGYLFCCYYFAYLSIAYGVTPLPSETVLGYDYVSLDTPKMVRLLQGLDLHSKRRVYQLAVLCARLSEYRTDKRIEKLLIAEVNDFDKKVQQNHLDDLLYQGAMPENLDELDNLDRLDDAIIGRQSTNQNDKHDPNDSDQDDNDQDDDFGSDDFNL